MFTDDVGTDFVLNAAGGGVPGGSNQDIQFNNAGAFGGFGSWDGDTLTIPGSQATIVIDETDGGGSAQLLVTSTATGDSAIAIVMDSSSGTDARIMQATSGGTLQESWIQFVKDGGVSLFFNGASILATGDGNIQVAGAVGDDTDPTNPAADNFNTFIDLTTPNFNALASWYMDGSNTNILENLAWEGRLEFWTTDNTGGGLGQIEISPFGASAGIIFSNHGNGRIISSPVSHC